MPRPFVDITGNRFSKLVVVSLIDRTKCIVRCDCGNEKEVRINNVKKGHTRSCGCMGKDNNLKHGVARDYPQLYQKWSNMMARCYRPSTKYFENYGGRGVSVCERWHNAALFVEDMLETYRDGLTLDRYPNGDGNYEPSNCRWATRIEQQNNLRTNTWIETPKGSMTIAQAAREFGLPYKIVCTRVSKGWSGHDAVTIPVGERIGKRRE